MGQNEQQASATVTASQFIRPGGTIVGVDGVKVVAPPNWREGQSAGVPIAIERLDLKTLPVPLPASFKPASNLSFPVYGVMADKNVFTADRDGFQVKVPIGSLDPRKIAPYVLSTVIIDSDSDSGQKRAWKYALGTKVTDGFIQFELSGFGAGSQILFTALLLDQ